MSIAGKSEPNGFTFFSLDFEKSRRDARSLDANGSGRNLEYRPASLRNTGGDLG